MKTDVLIVGSGCSGLYCALWLPKNLQITIITKSEPERSDSFLAQGGMCMLKNDDDYESYFEDTMKAGHYENDPVSVEIMIRSSGDVVNDLLSYGVRFAREENGELSFTKEGAHSANRIVFHKDITGKEITSHLLEEVYKRSNITLLSHTTLVDIVEKDNVCYGGVIRHSNGSVDVIHASATILATGGVGGLYRHSTNYKHLTGDALAIALKHNIELKDMGYVQIHPTTLYSKKADERSFLISESVRGEGAYLYDINMNRFTNELMPRDLLTNAIKEQMAHDHTEFVWEDLRPIPKEELVNHFPNIVEHCQSKGYDIHSECIPVVPAQHYFMGGIRVNHESCTSMNQLYAVGETACNGVHGRNRLASNSLLESLVFAKRAAKDITEKWSDYRCDLSINVQLDKYIDYNALLWNYREAVLKEIKRR